MEKPKQPAGTILPFALPEAAIEAQLEAWIAGIKESNDTLVAALQRLRDSYKTMMAGGSVKDAGEILTAVEAAHCPHNTANFNALAGSAASLSRFPDCTRQVN
jgi:hypothetical protein